MKNTNVLKSITLFTLMFFVFALVTTVTAQIPDQLPSAKQMIKIFLKYGKIEVTESSMEKQIFEVGDEYVDIKFTGTAVYTPARFGKKKFKDIQYLLAFDIYDKTGLKLMKVEGIPDCGENGQAENVKYKKPSPFEMTNLIPIDKYIRAESHKVKVWWILQ